MRITQHQKIINLCYDGQWVCQNQFRALYIFSPHKRRSEIELRGRYYFKKQKCQHGVANQFDYQMLDNPDYVPSKPMTSNELLQVSLGKGFEKP